MSERCGGPQIEMRLSFESVEASSHPHRRVLSYRMLRRIKRSIELDAGDEPDSESDTEIFLKEGEEHPLRPKFELPGTKKEDLDDPVGPTEDELVQKEEDKRLADEEKRVQEELRNADTAVSAWLHSPGGHACFFAIICMMFELVRTMRAHGFYECVCHFRTKRR